MALRVAALQAGGETNPETHWEKPGPPARKTTARFQVSSQTLFLKIATVPPHP